jgi:hypothetical protein
MLDEISREALRRQIDVSVVIRERLRSGRLRHPG